MKRLTLLFAVLLLTLGLTSANAATTLVSATPNLAMPKVHLAGDAPSTQKIDAYIPIGNTMIAVGSFSHVQSNGVTSAVHNVISFNATTGALNAFRPVISGELWSGLATSSALYLCGTSGLYKYDLPSYTLDKTFHAVLNDSCYAINSLGGHLTVMGAFTKVGSTARNMIASLYQSTGATDAGAGYYSRVHFTGSNGGGVAHIFRASVNPAGTKMVVIGNFSWGATGGNHQVAMISSSGVMEPWYPPAMSKQCNLEAGGVVRYHIYVLAVAWSPDGTYFVTTGTGGPHHGTYCDSIARFNYDPTNADAQPIWHTYFDGDTGWSVFVTSSTVYYGGHMRYVDLAGPIQPAQPLPLNAWCDPRNHYLGQEGHINPATGLKYSFNYGYNCPTKSAVYRPGVGSLSAATGAILPWNPERDRNEGARALLATSAGLWVGSDAQGAGCANPTAAGDCDGQTLLYVGGDAFFPNK